MTRTIHRSRLLAAVALLAAAALPAAHDAFAGPTPPSVPTAIQVPAGNKVFLIAHADGVQIYDCSPTADGYAWSLFGPRANLYDDGGKLVATHFRGPGWQARDGSVVVGGGEVVREPVDGAIPLLRIKTSSATAGHDGERFVGTTYIQRLATVGGLSPAASTCNATTSGARQEMPYTAAYVFWKATGN
jgi:hypothetical protein